MHYLSIYLSIYLFIYLSIYCLFDYKKVLTRYGKAVSESGLNPDEAVLYYEDLRCSQDNLNLETILHLVYLITPFQHTFTPNFNNFWDIFERSVKHNTPVHKILLGLEIEERFLFKWKNNPPSRETLLNCTNIMKTSKLTSEYRNKRGNQITSSIANDKKELSALCKFKRFWAAGILSSYLMGESKVSITKQYEISDGDLENLILVKLFLIYLSTYLSIYLFIYLFI